MKNNELESVFVDISSLITMLILFFLLAVVPITFVILIGVNYDDFQNDIPVTFLAIIVVAVLLMFFVFFTFLPRIKRKVYFNFNRKYIIYKNKRYFFEEVIYKKVYINHKELYVFYSREKDELFRIEIYKKVKKVIERFDLSL
ncbi:MAG: hypothetical protein MSS77_02310 [Mollicutes bacterium]|nr:hypothetical protein [Mollicutes bacterium]